MNTIHAHRTLRAIKLADVLRAHGATAAQAAALPEAGRAMCAALAGISTPSEATWSMAVAMLEAAEADVELFAGLPA